MHLGLSSVGICFYQGLDLIWDAPTLPTFIRVQRGRKVNRVLTRGHVEPEKKDIKLSSLSMWELFDG